MSDQAWPDSFMADLSAWAEKPGKSLHAWAKANGVEPETARKRLSRYRSRADVAPLPMVAQTAQLAPVDKPAESVKRHALAVVGCTHFGARHTCLAELEDFVDWAHEEHGVTTIRHAGDLLQGLDAKWSTEAKRIALDDQCDMAIEGLPRRPWLSWRFIGGNHDLKHEHIGGLDVGRYIVFRFNDAGRHDLTYLGPFEATDEEHVPGAPRPLRLDMRHQYGGGENLEPTLRRFVRRIPHRKDLPDFMLCAHPHRMAYAEAIGVHCVFAGCFDVARYGRAFPGAVDVGGVVLTYAIDGEGYPCDVHYHPHRYDVEQRV